MDPVYGTPGSGERACRRSRWTRTLKRVGARYRRPYNCSHTRATEMLMAGMSPAFAAAQLGHSVEIFLSPYSKWLPGQADDIEMAKLMDKPELSLECPQEKRRLS